MTNFEYRSNNGGVKEFLVDFRKDHRETTNEALLATQTEKTIDNKGSFRILV